MGSKYSFCHLQENILVLRTVIIFSRNVPKAFLQRLIFKKVTFRLRVVNRKLFLENLEMLGNSKIDQNSHGEHKEISIFYPKFWDS